MPLKLPRLPYEQKPYTPRIVTFGGVNYSQNHRDGELEDCRNLSSREYPCLSQRLGRTAVPGTEGATAVYDHDGRLVTVRNGRLYLGEKDICAVTDGAKQFAVVNSQLVVWPDGIVVDLTEEQVLKDCRPVVTANDASTVYDGSNITAPPDIPVGTRSPDYPSVGRNKFQIFIYGKDIDKVKACWDGKAWDLEKLDKIANEPRDVITVRAGDIAIPSDTMNLVTGYNGTPPDKSGYNTEGLFSVMGGCSGSTADGGSWAMPHTIYRVGLENTMFYEHFTVGDRVDVSGGDFGLVGTEHAEVGEVDVKANKLTFSGAEVIRQPVLYCPQALGRVRAREKVYLFNTYTQNNIVMEQYMMVSVEEEMPAGCITFGIKDESVGINNPSTTTYDKPILWAVHKVRFWHPEKKEVYGPYEVIKIDKNQMPEDYLTMELYPKTYALTITRSMPRLDYICSADNRLWGISNEDKTIWGSSLGKPFDFYTYAGLSTDSYAVAVGSDGEFTGCIGYGGNVLFWKEDKLHKLLGTAPENYQLYEYTVRGLMDGCHKSQVIINETLFFKSRDGVCAYTGSVPSLISESFGVRRFRDAAAGTDGEKYYVSMQDTRTDAWGLWVFDPATGLWLQEGAERVLDFANLDGTLYMLMDGGRVLMAGQTDSDEVIEWEATFCEMTEQHHERKCYSRLLLRMDLEPGAFCRGEISTDGGRFREVGILHGARNKTGEMLVQPTNCDRFQVRLKGRGRCRLKSLIREFTFGGER